MFLITVTHALKKEKIVLDVDMVWAAWYSDSSRATHVMSAAGAILPVEESVEFIMSKKKGEK